MGRIIIKKSIVHILNNKEKRKILNDFELTLSEKIENLIIKHIVDSQKHDCRKIASFKNDINIVKESCKKILDDEENFIFESKNIAMQLYDSMKGNASPANFMVCLYEEDEKLYIALLKMDFNEIYKPIVKNIDGKTKIEIEIIDGSLPNKKQKLQKCVFIPQTIFVEEGEEFIFILDKQSGEDVSDYFCNDFLHCDLVNSDKDNTKAFIKEMTSFINDEFSEQQLIGKECMDKMLRLLSEKKGNDIEIPELLPEIIGRTETVEKALEKFKSSLFDFNFKVDEGYVDARTLKRRMETNIGITLLGNASDFDSDNFFLSDEYEDGTIDITIKNVRIKEKVG